MNDMLLQTVTEFGAAGLIGVMWLLERASATKRERQLDEAHRRVLAHRRELKLWMSLVERNTRAFSALEAAHRELARALRRWCRRHERGGREG